MEIIKPDAKIKQYLNLDNGHILSIGEAMKSLDHAGRHDLSKELQIKLAACNQKKATVYGILQQYVNFI